MKISIVCLLLFLALVLLASCSSNIAQFSHFPSGDKMDLRAMDSLQDPEETSHHFFYNCNFENDYVLRVQVKSQMAAYNFAESALMENEFEIREDGKDGSVRGYRGQKSAEWETLAAVYVHFEKESSLIYIRTEITQDATCGPNIDRAKPIADKFCEFAGGCLEKKEVTLDTKRKLKITLR